MTWIKVIWGTFTKGALIWKNIRKRKSLFLMDLALGINQQASSSKECFKNGELDGLARTIYSQHGWHQGEYSDGRYHGAGACWRGKSIKLNPITTTDYLEIGIWREFLRQGAFDLITPQQEAWKATFKHNVLIEITEDLSGTDTFKKMKEVSDHYWSFRKFMNNY